jgi:hypothetical protein
MQPDYHDQLLQVKQRQAELRREAEAHRMAAEYTTKSTPLYGKAVAGLRRQLQVRHI